tara:strand:+ start:70 stop:414 length:345 start_codon:yes stop_codon:yes gene_type:complete
MSKKKEEAAKQEQIQTEISRVMMPRGKQTIGLLDERLGASRTRVKCLDGKTRICRIPGRLKRKLWVRPGDIVLVEPWEFGGDEKGDIIFKYRPAQRDYLQRKGMLDKLKDADEF